MKVRVIKMFFDGDLNDDRWYQPGDQFELKDPLPYLEAGLVVPVRKREIETAIRKAPETQVTR